MWWCSRPPLHRLPPVSRYFQLPYFNFPFPSSLGYIPESRPCSLQRRCPLSRLFWQVSALSFLCFSVSPCFLFRLFRLFERTSLPWNAGPLLRMAGSSSTAHSGTSSDVTFRVPTTANHTKAAERLVRHSVGMPVLPATRTASTLQKKSAAQMTGMHDRPPSDRERQEWRRSLYLEIWELFTFAGNLVILLRSQHPATEIRRDLLIFSLNANQVNEIEGRVFSRISTFHQPLATGRHSTRKTTLAEFQKAAMKGSRRPSTFRNTANGRCPPQSLRLRRKENGRQTAQHAAQNGTGLQDCITASRRRIKTHASTTDSLLSGQLTSVDCRSGRFCLWAHKQDSRETTRDR